MLLKAQTFMKNPLLTIEAILYFAMIAVLSLLSVVKYYITKKN